MGDKEAAAAKQQTKKKREIKLNIIKKIKLGRKMKNTVHVNFYLNFW